MNILKKLFLSMIGSSKNDRTPAVQPSSERTEAIGTKTSGLPATARSPRQERDRIIGLGKVEHACNSGQRLVFKIRAWLPDGGVAIQRSGHPNAPYIQTHLA